MKKILFVLIAVATLVSCDKQKTAYVDTTKLIQDYQEMKDIEAEFEKKSTTLRQSLDSIGMGFQVEVQKYQSKMAEMSQAERQQAEAELMQLQQQLQQQQQNRSGELRAESEVIVDSLISKVKKYVKEYGEENNYTYIFGSNETANIMYAEEGLDITEEILTKLNEAYKKEE
ncbi:MAG TPA: OmpH family outer membrane protein [Salinimicrobium sp.]|nr:OmpH family outer membrane protein [Salinimicrobium sp.]